MKIVFIVTGLKKAGAETQVVGLATCLRSRGLDVSVITLAEPEAYADVLSSNGITVRTLSLNRRIPNPFFMFKLVSLLKHFDPDVIHSHMVHANIVSRIAALFVRKPKLICTAHSIYEGRWLRTLLYRFTDRLCYLTTNVAKAGVDISISTRKVPPHKIRYVPNGIEPSLFSFDEETRARKREDLGVSDLFVFLAIGRFEPAKDYRNLLQAFEIVCKSHDAVVLLIAGEGVLREETEALCHDLLLSDKVHFLGLRSDIDELMMASDSYVMSSAWEGMPLVLLEASSSQLAIVATDVGGNRDIVLDDRSGFLVPPKDPAKLAASMLRMLCLSPEARLQMGLVGRSHVVMNYSMSRIADIWQSIYSERSGTY